ncbi:hypothetical protein BLOT_014528 [Blomia tropicalis]|nr:hypothetical protein BLOT_014528 [Blomia tropicalis]
MIIFHHDHLPLSSSIMFFNYVYLLTSESLYPSTSTTTFSSFILVLINIIHSSISTATPINIFILIFDNHRQNYIHQYQQNI